MSVLLFFDGLGMPIAVFVAICVAAFMLLLIALAAVVGHFLVKLARISKSNDPTTEDLKRQVAYLMEHQELLNQKLEALESPEITNRQPIDLDMQTEHENKINARHKFKS